MENVVQDSSAIEAEIAVLTKEINEKRAQLEASRNISSEIEAEKSIVREVVGERLNASQNVVQKPVGSPNPVSPVTSNPTDDTHASYLDNLDPATVGIVNNLIENVFKNGLDATIRDLKVHTFLTIDAFHDALSDKVYEELKRRKIVK